MIIEIDSRTCLLKRRTIVMSSIINNIKDLMSILMLDYCSILIIASIKSLTDITVSCHEILYLSLFILICETIYHRI